MRCCKDAASGVERVRGCCMRNVPASAPHTDLPRRLAGEVGSGDSTPPSTQWALVSAIVGCSHRHCDYDRGLRSRLVLGSAAAGHPPTWHHHRRRRRMRCTRVPSPLWIAAAPQGWPARRRMSRPRTWRRPPGRANWMTCGGCWRWASHPMSACAVAPEVWSRRCGWRMARDRGPRSQAGGVWWHRRHARRCERSGGGTGTAVGCRRRCGGTDQREWRMCQRL